MSDLCYSVCLSVRHEIHAPVKNQPAVTKLNRRVSVTKLKREGRAPVTKLKAGRAPVTKLKRGRAPVTKLKGGRFLKVGALQHSKSRRTPKGNQRKLSVILRACMIASRYLFYIRV